MKKKPKNNEAHVISLSEYAKKEGISRQGAHKRIQNNKINAVRIGNGWAVIINNDEVDN